MIKIQKSDTIVDILKKIWKEESNKIILDFPFWHPVLYNHLSLKIIKSKTVKKDLLILTNDRTSKKIWWCLWIKYWKKSSEDKYSSLNQKTLKENYTFFEYALFEIKLFFWLIKWNVLGIKKINKIYYENNKFRENHKIILIIFLLMLSLIFLILLYIYSFTINRTVITITPEILVKLKSKNFNYVEYNINTESNEKNVTKYRFNNEIKLRKISKTINIEKVFSTTWISQDEKDISSWEILIKNFLEEKVNLLENTIFENDKWIEFYIKSNVRISPAIKDENGNLIPWEKKAIVYWKAKLKNWLYSWKKTNIWTWVLLTIPKLKEEQSKIFAKTITKISGWTDNYKHFLKEEDLETAKNLLNTELKRQSISEINNIIDKENRSNSLSIKVLPVDNIYKYYNKKIEVPDYLKIWYETDKFTLKWKITIDTFVYNEWLVISKLNDLIKERNISWYEQIEQINLNSLRISHIITRNDLVKNNWKYSYMQKMNKDLRIKWTTEIDYFVTRKFNESDQYINRLKNLILWLDKEEAEKILINNAEINNIKIDIEPFFLNNISKNINNIEIKIED